MAVLAVDQVLTGAALGLSYGLSDLLVLDIGGRRVLYALSRTEGALVEIEVTGDGTLSAVGSLTLAGTFAVGSEPMLTAYSGASGAVSLAVSGLSVSPGQTVSLAPDGAIGSETPMANAGVLVAPVSVTLGSTEGLIIGRSGGIDLLTDTGGGYALAATLSDAGDRYLADVSASATFNLGGTTYLATTSSVEHGVNLAEVTSTSLTHRGALGATDGLPINTPTELGVLQRMGETLLVVGGFNTSSLSVVRVEGGGTLQIADHILDSPATRFQAISALDTLAYGDFGFVAAGGGDGGVSLFTVLPGGRMVHLDSLADDATTSLYRVSGIELITTGQRLDLIASSTFEPGVTRIGYDLAGLGAVLVSPMSGGSLSGTALDDQIIGSHMDDTLAGGSGDDIVLDGAGQDIMTGGAGADLFVFHPDGQQDTITDYDRAIDRLDLSAFDFLYDVSQLSITPTQDGAVLSHGSETLVIHASDGAPLTAADFSNATILNVDRPPLVPFAQSLTGSAANDTLIGAAGNDTINGSTGDDFLRGMSGNDSILGGDGADRIEGDAGNDTLLGDSDGDTIIGGTGDDLIFGGAGGDLIYGDDWGG